MSTRASILKSNWKIFWEKLYSVTTTPSVLADYYYSYYSYIFHGKQISLLLNCLTYRCFWQGVCVIVCNLYYAFCLVSSSLLSAALSRRGCFNHDLPRDWRWKFASGYLQCNTSRLTSYYTCKRNAIMKVQIQKWTGEMSQTSLSMSTLKKQDNSIVLTSVLL